uniref:Lipocalin/cytosolic fatty-acid binding domain-containing protein n=2 Tax=Sus scrofa TaxID=9823 RepID=A0A8D0RZ65_PIG
MGRGLWTRAETIVGCGLNKQKVGGNWFSAAMASNQPQLMKAAGARRILIHHIQVTPRALRFHLHQRINGVCVPTVMTANKTKKKFQYLLEYIGQNRVFLEKVDPKSYAIICTHHKARGREMVVVTLLSSECRRGAPPNVCRFAWLSTSLWRTRTPTDVPAALAPHPSVQRRDEGRTPEVSRDTLRMFLSYCRKHGLHEPSVIDLTRTDRCLHARQ